MTPPEQQNYVIGATSALADVETRILKHGEAFGIFDLRGDIYSVSNDELGIYYRGTRYLSRFELRLAGRSDLLLLNSHLRTDDGVLKVELTNPDLPGAPKGTVYLSREMVIQGKLCFLRLVARNFSGREVTLPLILSFQADFRDIFEVRGTRRERRGKIDARPSSDREVDIAYHGLDNLQRHTLLSFSFPLDALSSSEARFTARVPSGGEVRLDTAITFAEGAETFATQTCEAGIRAAAESHQQGKRRYCEIASPSSELTRWVERSRDDLVMLTTKTISGEDYPYAGVPWYSTVFGRDGIWTALFCLWANPSMAAGVLRLLARYQAKAVDPEADAEPGKILHEMRTGEMAALKEIPFGLYYGSVDSTPLFLVLAGEYHRRTGDDQLISEIWDNLLLANDWIDRYGDADGDGYVRYGTKSKRGLTQQGWKDSHDSIFHADGSDAPGPIALCEVQAYVFEAKRSLAGLAERRGHSALAARLRKESERLRENFQRDFWLPELGTLALALDGKNRPCAVETSNAGHALRFGIVTPEQAARMAQSLTGPDLFSGWGLRTLSAKAARYNPMSYHNGSVWPHDNAIAAQGLARYGQTRAAEKIFEAMFGVSEEMELTRMPELFCGFARQDNEPPTQYPVACSPQAWASASLYGLVQALLGIEISAEERRVTFLSPSLPPAVPELRIKGLSVLDARADIVFERNHGSVSMRVEKKEGDLTVRTER